jgi:uncharacterized protein (DUF885 family)
MTTTTTTTSSSSSNNQPKPTSSTLSIAAEKKRLLDELSAGLSDIATEMVQLHDHLKKLDKNGLKLDERINSWNDFLVKREKIDDTVEIEESLQQQQQQTQTTTTTTSSSS